MSFLDKFDSFHLDILKEVGNIGAGHAATALSQLLNKPIDMKVPAVRIVSFNEIPDLVGGSDNVVAAVLLRVNGDAPGNMFYLSPVKEATNLIRQLLGDNTFSLETEPVSEIGLSAFQEVGNILVGSYLSSLSDLTNLNLQPSVPAFTIDMASAILSYGLIELSQVGDFAIVIDTEITKKTDDYDQQSAGQLFLLPDPESFKKIFMSLGVSIDE